MSIEEIKSRLDAATPGPWEMREDDLTNDVDVVHDQEQVSFVASCGNKHTPRAYSDAEFIAHAPEDMRRLLAAVEAVEGWMQNLDAVERAKPTDPNDLNCSARDVARNVRAAIRAALEAS